MHTITANCQFDTKRLKVRQWRDLIANAETRKALILELSSLLTPAVLKHLPEPMQPENHDLDAWITTRDGESDVCCIHDRNKGEFLGLLILASFPGAETDHTIRIGYFLEEPAWGKGIATKLLHGFLDWCQNQKESIELLAGVETDNPASAALLKKVGFELLPAQSDTETETYQLIL